MPIDLFEKLEILISLRTQISDFYVQSNLLSERKIDLKKNKKMSSFPRFNFKDILAAAVLQLL